MGQNAQEVRCFMNLPGPILAPKQICTCGLPSEAWRDFWAVILWRWRMGPTLGASRIPLKSKRTKTDA